MGSSVRSEQRDGSVRSGASHLAGRRGRRRGGWTQPIPVSPQSGPSQRAAGPSAAKACRRQHGQTLTHVTHSLSIRTPYKPSHTHDQASRPGTTQAVSEEPGQCTGAGRQRSPGAVSGRVLSHNDLASQPDGWRPAYHRSDTATAPAGIEAGADEVNETGHHFRGAQRRERRRAALEGTLGMCGRSARPGLCVRVGSRKNERMHWHEKT